MSGGYDWCQRNSILIDYADLGRFAFVRQSKIGAFRECNLKVNGEKDMKPIGGTLLGALQSGGIFLSSACGGGGKCGQCRAQIIDQGGGEILPTEKGFFSRKQVKDHWRLGLSMQGERGYGRSGTRRGIWR